MSRYFVTGAQGFVGRHLVSHILSTEGNAQVLGAGRTQRLAGAFTHTVTWGTRRVAAPLPDGVLAALETHRYQYVSLELRQDAELACVLRDFRPDVVIHLASALRDDPTSALMESNIEGTSGLLEALAAAGTFLRKLVVCSTGGVCGIPTELPIREDAPCNPIDLYSASKLAAENFSRILARRHQIPTVWARLFNVVGPGQDERHICGRFVAQAAAIASGVTPPVMHVGALDTSRDFADVRDMASALLLIAEKGEAGSIYNAASGVETPTRSILQSVLQLAGLAGCVEIEQCESRAVDIPRHLACVERLRSSGFSCRYGLAQSIRDLLDYYRDRVRAAAGNGEDPLN